MEITRGTTPTLKIYIDDTEGAPVALDEFSGEATLKQGTTVIQREFAYGTIPAGYMPFDLTQEETLSLSATRPAHLQVRLKNASGTVKASETVRVTVLPATSEAVM